MSRLSLAALPFVVGVASAQCAFTSYSVAAYGQSCGSSSFTSPFLSAFFDPSTCALDFVVNGTVAFTELQGAAWLAIGTQPLNMPLALPMLPSGCTLLTNADLYLSGFVAGPGASSFHLPLPNAPLPPVTLHSQGIAWMFLPSGQLRLSFGVRLDLQ